MSTGDWLQTRAAEHCLEIAIDGPAGAGKSTVGHGLAERLGCRYLDTGLMYRAITWLALQNQLSTTDAAALERLARATTFAVGTHGDELVFNDIYAGPFLRTPEVDALVSQVAAFPQVREQMVARQRQLARAGCVVVVGRDIGTIVLPGAPVKLWVTASAQARARRRLSERLPGSAGLDEAEMVTRIERRDALDAGRAVAPLRRADDAVDIVTDGLTPEESVQHAVRAVEAHLLAADSSLATSAGEGHRSPPA